MINVEGVERGESLCGGGNRCCETEGNNEEGRGKSGFAHNFSERFRRNEEGGITLAWDAARHYVECKTQLSMCRILRAGFCNCRVLGDKSGFLRVSNLGPQTSDLRPQTSDLSRSAKSELREFFGNFAFQCIKDIGSGP